MTLRDQILAAAAPPDAALALLILGALLVYVEFLAPGKVLPAALGSVAMLLAAKSLAALDIWWPAALLLTLGILCLLLGQRTMGTMAFVAGAWKLTPGIHLPVAAGLGAPFALITAFLHSTALRARRNKRIDL